MMFFHFFFSFVIDISGDGVIVSVFVFLSVSNSSTILSYKYTSNSAEEISGSPAIIWSHGRVLVSSMI